MSNIAIENQQDKPKVSQTDMPLSPPATATATEPQAQPKLRKKRSKDDTLDMFHGINETLARVKRVASALKAIRRAWGINEQWPAPDVAALMSALSELVQPPPPTREPQERSME